MKIEEKAADRMLFGVFLAQTSPADLERHIGNIRITVDVNHDIAEIAYMLGNRQIWGKGLATQALSLAIDWVFSELGLAKIYADTYETNESSLRLLKRLGFKEEGRRILHVLDDSGVRRDLKLFGLHKHDWH